MTSTSTPFIWPGFRNAYREFSQTLGLRSKKTAGAIKFISQVYAIIIYAGFLAIPLAIKVFGFGCCK